MTIREQTQEIQARTLSKYASLSQNSLGRERPVEDCPRGPLTRGTATGSSTASRLGG